MSIKKYLIVFCIFFQSSIGVAQTVPPVDPYKSLMITNHVVLDSLISSENNFQYDLAYQLGRVSDTLGRYKGDPRGSKREITSPGNFVVNIFTAATHEQTRHNDGEGKLGTPLGIPVPNEKLMQAVFDHWPKRNPYVAVITQLNETTDLEKLKGSPFRLIAIANLMNLAGDIDDRGLPPAGQSPRSLGEIHLVYGYVNPIYEAQHNRAFPQTFVLSYRLPTLPDGQLAAPTHEELVLSGNVDKWKRQMQLWANHWQALSTMSFDSDGFKAKLNWILDNSVKPKNFLNLRSNTRITDEVATSEEFELREFYINDGDALTPRKPRNEPYRCLQHSELLSSLIKHYWMKPVKSYWVGPEYADLNVSTITFEGGVIPLGNGRNGYTVFRTLQGVTTYNSFMTSKKYEKEDPIKTDMSFCNPTSVKDAPFQMKDPDQSPLLVAPFARVDKDTVWTLTVNKIPSVTEKQRHQFAMRTCSGCHGIEGVATNGKDGPGAKPFGFHIRNRLPEQTAILSPFLTGAAGKNTYSYGGQTYSYGELAKRKDWLERALVERPGKPLTLFKSLQRDDAAP